MVDWIITEYSDPYFNILYKDGSVETLTRKQLSKLLVYDDDVKTRAERDENVAAQVTTL